MKKVAWHASSASCGFFRRFLAHVQNHRPVPLENRRERLFGRLTVERRKPFHQLRVRQIADHPYLKQGLDLLEDSRV